MKQNHKNLVQHHFDHYSNDWHNRLKDYLFHARRLEVQSILQNLPYSSVLDIGCGSGDYAPLFDRTKCSYLGMDLSEKMIHKCRELYPNYTFQVGDGENICTGDQSFDLVLSIAVLEYLETPHPHLAEISRVLCQGGRAVVAIQNAEEIFRERDKKIRTIFQPLLGLKKIFYKNGAEIINENKSSNTRYIKDSRIFHKKYSLEEIKKLGAEHKLNLTTFSYVNLKLLPTISSHLVDLNPFLCKHLRSTFWQAVRQKYCSILLVVMQKR